ncbi:MAG: thiamine pyrophosphate-requiring protein [Myxococcales bacterium]|nr:MAG: thiamine pyrophosphate-requiring protein [Myxococcales bacterium]
MTSKKVSDFLIERLTAWGVEVVYGYSGDGINGILGALGRAGNRPRFVQPPHEELCALMATGYAKYSGKVGVCLVTQGPGAVHALNGLYDAKLDHQPVVAILGQVSQSAAGSYYQQEIDLVSLFKDVAHEHVHVLASPEQAHHLIDRAFRSALAERTVAAIIVPHDVQQKDAVAMPAPEHGKLSSSAGYVAPRVLPQQSELQRAAEVLNAGRKVALLVGAGALAAGDEVLRVAERLDAGIAKALLGKAAVPDDLPCVTGSIGWLGTRASNEMMKQCDTLLIVGSQFPYTEYLPKPGQARAVQIDIDGKALGGRYPTEVDLAGDSAETLRALLPLLEPRATSPFREQVRALIAESRREQDELAMGEAHPLNPARVFWELNRVLPDDLVIAGDCGTATFWYAKYLDLRKGMLASLSGTLATMGSALPYALAAKVSFSDRPVLALVGDGAMQMNGLNALITVAQHWKDWKDPRLVIVVLNNRQLSYVTWEQRAMEGDPKFGPSQDLMDFPFARYAELLGLEGERVATIEDLQRACERAFHAKRPLLIEAVTDPNVPPLPAELTTKQRELLKKAFAQPDEDLPGALQQAEKLTNL